MKKNYVITWFLLLGVIATGHAQRVVKGVVQAASDKIGLPGVTVLVKGTEMGVSTDMQGNYQLVSSRDTVTLVFSFVGFETLEKRLFITRDTTTLFPVLLKESCTVDLLYNKYAEFMLSSGLRYSPLGGRIKVFYPFILKHWYKQGSLRTEFSYQFRNNNYQRNGTVALDNAFIDCDNNVDVTADYQSVQLGEQRFSYNRYTAGATYTGAFVSTAIPVYLAVGRLNYSAEDIHTVKAGIEAGAGYPFYIYLNNSRTSSLQVITTGRIAWWQDYWQFQSSLEMQFRRFTARINFNKLGQYAEVNTGLGFRIERRYRAKKAHD